jgi:hypothetical protein
MDPNLKIALDEMQRRYQDEMRRHLDDLDTKLDNRFLDDDRRHNERVTALETLLLTATMEFDAWRPQIDSAGEDLKLKVTKINKHLDCVVLDRSASDPPLLD